MDGNAPQRIVSLAPSNTEILFAIGAGPRVVGITRFCDYPVAAQRVEARVGGFMDVDAEAVLALKPDLVLAGTTFSERQRAPMLALKEAGVQVEFIEPRSYLDVLASVSRVGALVGAQEGADGLASRMLTETNRILARVPSEGPRPRVYYEEWPGNPTLTVGPGIWIHDMIEMAGCANVFGHLKEPEPAITPEAVVEADPDVVLLGWCGMGTRADPRRVQGRPGWSGMRAVKENRVFPVNDSLFTRPGPRVVEGLARLVELIGPGPVPA